MKQRFPKGLVVSELTSKSMVASSESVLSIKFCLMKWGVKFRTKALDRRSKTKFIIDSGYMVGCDKDGYFLMNDQSAMTLAVTTTKHEVLSLTVESEVRLMSTITNRLRCHSRLQIHIENLLTEHSIEHRIDLVSDGEWCLVTVYDHTWEVIDSDGSQKCILFNYKIGEICMK